MDIQTGCLFLLWADVHTLCFTQWLSWTVQSLYTSTVENQAPGWPQERLGEWADAGKWDTSNITCMNRIDQSHAPKLVTDRQAQARKKWLIGLSAHAGAKNLSKHFHVNIFLFFYKLDPQKIKLHVFPSKQHFDIILRWVYYI